MKIKRKNSFAAEVATSSLNDIMFFLLLFFLIISTITNPNVIKVLLPRSGAAQAPITERGSKKCMSPDEVWSKQKQKSKQHKFTIALKSEDGGGEYSYTPISISP